MKSQADFKIQFLGPVLRLLRNSGAYCHLMIFFLVSCSTFIIPTPVKNRDLSTNPYSTLDEKDYSDHLASLKISFLATPGVKTLRLSTSSEKYIQDLLNEIISKNEIFFKRLKSAKVNFIELDAPVYFSLPKGELFFSSGLIAKYIKHESMLVSILAYELVRSENLAYPKQTFVPVGYLPLDRILSLGRIGITEKMEVHKWAHYITVRSGYDGEYYLSWLQIQNRNTADFIMQVGDANMINREESLFKSFLIKNTREDELQGKTNSSKLFYSFINSIRDQSI